MFFSTPGKYDIPDKKNSLYGQYLTTHRGLLTYDIKNYSKIEYQSDLEDI